MKKTIAIKIDVTKIDKSRLYKGKNATYLDAIIHYSDEKDQYDNNGMIVEAVSKDERTSGVKGTILGNAKTLWSESSTNTPPKKDIALDEGFDDMTNMMDNDLPL